jgi:hypothetical protein
VARLEDAALGQRMSDFLAWCFLEPWRIAALAFIALGLAGPVVNLLRRRE